MKPINFNLSHFTELNAEQLHALQLNKEGKLEAQTNSVLSTEEIAALQRIQYLLDDLKFARDSD